MSYTTTMTSIDSEDGMHSSIHNETPAADNTANGRKGRRKGRVLKKGPWTLHEDRILINYVKEHGEGNWNDVQKKTLLSRCGKSCRLRWANHLRPNLKKGPFSKDEEQKIVKMHAKWGNKWAKMAERLPGRTDNEIKNYWNTRIKRRQRSGLPLYPPDIHVENLQRSEEYPTSNIGVDSRRHQDFLQLGNSKFYDLNFGTSLLPGASDLSDMFTYNMLGTCAITSRYESYMPPFLFSPNPILESISWFPMCSSNIKHEFQSPEEHFQNADPQKNPSSCIMSPCDVDHSPYGNQHSSDMMIPDSHTFTDGMFSTSKPPFGAVKLELPSFQYSETSAFGPWKMTLSPPQSDLLDSVDAYIQSPPPLEIEDSSFDTGLLNMLVEEGKIKASAKDSLCWSSLEKSFDSTTCTTGVTQNVPHGGETQIKSDEFEDTAGRISSAFTGNVIKTEDLDQIWEPKPDVLLESIWLSPRCFETFRESSSLSNDDIGNYYKNFFGSSSSQATRGVESFAWTNNVPHVWSVL